MSLTRMLAARPLIEKTLGPAVHPLAIDRLLELWPEAKVGVRHYEDRWDGVDLKVTSVTIWEFDVTKRVGGFAMGTARCRLDSDVWDRRHGIDLAFRRALEGVPR